MEADNLSYQNVTNHDQLRVTECGGLLILRNQKTFNFADCDKIVLTSDRPKKTHTVHLVTHCQNLWSFLIIISKNKIDPKNKDFKPLPQYSVQKGDLVIDVYWHNKRKVIFISTNEKAWMSLEVSKVMWSLVLFKPPRKMDKIFTTFDGAPGQVFPIMKQMYKKVQRQ